MNIGGQDNIVPTKAKDMISHKTIYRFLNVNGKETVIELCDRLPEISKTDDRLYLIIGNCNLTDLGNPKYHFKGIEKFKDAVEEYELGCMKRGNAKSMQDYYLTIVYLPKLRRGYPRARLRKFFADPLLNHRQVKVDLPTPPLLKG